MEKKLSMQKSREIQYLRSRRETFNKLEECNKTEIYTASVSGQSSEIQCLLTLSNNKLIELDKLSVFDDRSDPHPELLGNQVTCSSPLIC